MNRKTITKEFNELYGNGKNLNSKKNTSIPNMLNKIPDIENVTNNIVENYNKNYDKPISEAFVPFKFPYIPLLIITLLIALGGVIYYFKDNILDFFDKIYKIDTVEKKTDNIIKQYNNDKIKQLEEDKKKLEEDLKTKEQKNNVKNVNINNGGLNELNNAINNSTSYKKEQNVKENSFCYIGYDDGQRVCTNAFEGDTCMSGQIFPKMDICINPRLSS
uniref:Uncharacterized protein n=1 Tax=viral metagenome TaxID=1070528 RepID=A0A6C0JLQ8_9ZZZZ